LKAFENAGRFVYGAYVSWIASINRRELMVSDCSKPDPGKPRTTHKTRSAASRLGYSETVFQHLKADNLTIGNGKHDCEVRLDDLAGSLDLDSNEPRMTARSLPAKMSRTLKLIRSIMARESLTKSVIAVLPDFFRSRAERQYHPRFPSPNSR
jgi:hypothetical protein